MAKPPMAAKKNTPPPPADDDDTDDGAPQAGADAGGDDDAGGEGEEGSPTVLCTVMDNHDGSYTLIHGDEPEAAGGADDGAEGEEPEEGAEPPEGEEGDDNAPEPEDEDAGGETGEGEEGPKQEHFDNPGELLHGILKILDEAEAESGGGEHAFAAGFDESHNPTPKM